jgi:ethanolamine utilization microcompartment shell protein EutS
MAMAQAAIGLIETRGLVGLLEAADAAAKAAHVQLLGFEQIGGGLVSVRFSGDVAAVQAGVQAGVQAASRLTQVISHHVIPAPHPDLTGLLKANSTLAPPLGSANPLPLPEDLENLPVPQLRRLVRHSPHARLKGRQISSANKETLLAELRRTSQKPT